MRDNAEGSSRSSLTGKQQAVLAGTLLGDGCLAQHGRYHRLHVKHKEAHRTLAELKYEVFREFISMKPHRFDQRLGERSYPCVQFATRTAPIFSEWHERFYRGSKKIVPLEIARFLSPQALAVWFMDDGAADHAGATIQTHSFDLDEVELLRSVLRVRFGLEAKLRKNKGSWILYICSTSVGPMREILGPHLLPEFGYKLSPRRSRTP